MSRMNPSSGLKLEGGFENTQLVPDTPEALSASDIPAGDPVFGLRLPMSQGAQPSTREEAKLINRKPLRTRVSPVDDTKALQIATQCNESSVTYFDANHRQRMIDAAARFNSMHPKGSKYWKPAFERRSRLFRPKTRSTIRKREAAAALSIFGSSDIVSVSAVNSGDPKHVQDARAQDALLNYRLEEDERWYKFAIGAVQDGDNTGLIIGCTEWQYEESVRYFDELHPEYGLIKSTDRVVTIDRPNWRLIPIENFRFSPSADWVDPIGSSPYIIEVRPMYICDIRKNQANPRARLKYRDLTDQQLLTGGKTIEWDSIRTQRERNRQDRYDRLATNTDYMTAWVHRNYVKIDGEWYVYDTIGSAIMLSDVTPLSEFDPRGYPPYVIGGMMFEAHNPYPVGGNELMSQMQSEINETSNLRIDGMKMATSGRMFIKRGTGIDLNALARFSPGAVAEMDDPSKDVKWDFAKPPPQSSFEEQQLLQTELDDLMGNFNSQSVANNRNLNETVGGMEMISGAADQLTEYDLHTFVKTFLQKILKQTLDLERMWETDNNIAQIIGQKMQMSIRQFWDSLKTPTKVKVNVGFGATNPVKRVQKLDMGLGMLAKYFPSTLMEADQNEIATEVFSSIGYPDAKRFLPNLDTSGNEDPRIRALRATIATLRQQAEPIQAKIQGDLQREQIRGQTAARVAQITNQGRQAAEQYKQKTMFAIRMAEMKLAYVELQLEHEKNQIARAELMLEREKLSNDIAMQWREFQLQEASTAEVSNPVDVEGIPAAPQAKSNELSQPGSALAVPSFADVAQAAGEQAQQMEQDTNKPGDASGSSEEK